METHPEIIMPKQLVIEACIVNYHDDKGGQHQNVGDIISVTKQDAKDLADAGRTLYLVKAEDHTKGGLYTATNEMIKAAKDMAKARETAASQPAV